MMVPIHALQWYRFADTVTEFRCLLKMRLKYYEAENKSVFLKAMRIFVTLFTRFHNLYFYTEPNMIGDNLLLHHAFATVISAEKIGDNCHIYQQVTIGNGGGRPKT